MLRPSLYLDLQLAFVQGRVDQREHGGVGAGWGQTSARRMTSTRGGVPWWGGGPWAREPPQAAIRGVRSVP